VLQGRGEGRGGQDEERKMTSKKKKRRSGTFVKIQSRDPHRVGKKDKDQI